MEKLDPKKDGASADTVAENVEALKQLFPDIVTEGKIDFDALHDVLGDYVDDRPERSSFSWHGKGMARKIAQTPSTGTLRPCPEESVNWDSTQNLFIEGDNLEVLKLLQKSYHRKVKMIYIDPPYNTGGEFIYPDKYQDNLQTYLRYTAQVDEEGLKLSANAETSGRYHTNWLNMMLPRLKLARNLLSDDGLIAVSIDDHEVHNLRHICDEVFGPENFVADLIWRSRTSISNDQEVSLNHNHTLLYSRDRDALVFYGEALNEAEYSNPDDDSRGPWKLVPIDANKPGGETQYAIRNPKTGEDYYPPNGRSWAFNPSEYNRLLEDGRIKFGMNDDSAPKKKLFLKEREAKGDTKTPSSVLLDAGTTKDGTTEMMELFDGKKVFDYPKPSKLMKRLLNYACHGQKPNLVLDFFAGSCSLAHACLDWKHGKVRFIMVQLPEPVDSEKPYGKTARSMGMMTIADIGKERIRRCIAQAPQGGNGRAALSDKANERDLGFKVFKLASSNIKPWDGDFDNLDQALFNAVENVKEDRGEADVLYELLLKYGLDLAVSMEQREIGGKTVFVIGAGALVVCLAADLTLDVVDGIAALKDELQPELMRVVFRDAGFKDDVVKTNAVQILRQAGISDVKSL
jgi:adenine-specific DNA-methyltransferase